MAASLERSPGLLTLALLLAIFWIPALADTDQHQPDLQALIDVGIAFTDHSIEVRRNAITKAKALLSNSSRPIPEQQATLGIADGYLEYQLGNLAAAIHSVQQGLDAITLASHPDLYVRGQSLKGGLMLTAGQKQEGLATLEQIFEQDLSGVSIARIESARVNYASGLVQNGRVQEASQAYERALLYALSNENDVLGLSAGGNYISLLRDQNMSAQAEYWLNQLRPAMQRKPNTMATAALMIYDYGLLISKGESKQAIAKIETFLNSAKPMPDLVRAHGEEQYSEALLAEGRHTASLAAAERALALLDKYPVEQPEAIMAIIRTALAMQSYDLARVHLESLERFDLSRPANIVEFRKLRLEYALQTSNIEAANTSFDEYLAANQSLVNFLSQRQADYYEEKLDKQRTELELKLAREEQALLKAESATQKAQANEASIRENSLRQQRRFIIGFAILAGLAGISFFYFNAKRLLQARLRDNLRQQNASLAALVDRKSQDLVQQVTEQSKLEQVLAERRHMEAIGQIAGNVAHDFNNVLQVVSSTNDLLAPRAQGSTERNALAASNQSVQSVSSTIGQLLAYSRKQQLETSLFKMADYIDSNRALFRSAVGDANQLTIETRCADAWVELDPGQLTASIINLLSNAAEALDTPGEIRLAATLEPLEGANPRSEHILQLQIQDSGRGMDNQTLQQAASPYYTTKPGGTGLGLSSVYGFAVQSGGEVLVTSHPGVGTNVSLRFPLQAEPAASAPAQTNDPQSLDGCCILVVEDNPLIAQTLIAILNREGAQASWVGSADLAQEELQLNSKIDLLLSDIVIPGAMDGLGLAQWVREKSPQVRIGLMSGYGPSAQGDLDLPILSKPFSAQELTDYLKQRRATT